MLNMIKKIQKNSHLVITIIITVLFLNSCGLYDDLIHVEPIQTSKLGVAPDKLRFVAIGDAGKGNTGQYKVAKAVKKKCVKDGCDFVLYLGDNIYQSGVSSVSDQQFQEKFELPYKDLDMPFFVVLGNHDYGMKGAGFDVKRSIHQIKYSNISSKWYMPRHYYKFNVQNAAFFALDTNAQLFELASEQEVDVKRWIDASSSIWKIAFGHHPYKSNGVHGNAGRYSGLTDVKYISGSGVKEFSESVWCGKVDLYLSGHDHSKQWLGVTCAGTQLAISGAGATVTKLQGNNPSLYESDTLGFLYISIEGNKLTAEMIDLDGEIEFKHIITK